MNRSPPGEPFSGLGPSSAEICTIGRFSRTTLMIDYGDDLGVHGFRSPSINTVYRKILSIVRLSPSYIWARKKDAPSLEHPKNPKLIFGF